MYGRQRRPMEESIYDLIPQPQAQQTRASRYVSKYPSDTPPTSSTFGRSSSTTVKTTNLQGDYELETKAHKWKTQGSTMGHGSHYSDPTQYAKKSATDLPEPKAFRYKTTLKTPVVKRTEKPVMNQRTNKNFVKENALEIIMSEPGKKSVPEPDFLTKKEYGRVPKYLKKVQKEISAEKDYINECIAQEHAMYQQREPQMQLLPEDERLKLLEQLKAKWEQVNKNYQQMTHIVTLDTIGKCRRKEEFESQLQQLEKSIEKISKPFVFVQDTQGYY